MFDLKNKIALVTGATGGIGEAISRKLHEYGAHVYLSGSNMEKLESLQKDLGSNCSIKQCDLSNSSNAQEMINSIEKIDILVCNAGITRDNLSIKMTEEDFDKVIDINLKANFVLNKTAIKKMIRARYGRIINIASVVGVSGNPGQANYCASKAGLIGMSKSLAQEVASRGVTINCIAPGFIASKMTDAISDAHKDMMMSRIPQKRFGSPEDVANCTLFLANDESSYITGQTIHVNGGMLMI